MKAEHVCASKETLRKVFISALWHQVLEEQLKHLRSSPLSILLCNGFPQNSLQLLWVYTTSLVEVWTFLSSCTSLIHPASESHVSPHISCCEFTIKIIREQICRVNPPTCWGDTPILKYCETGVKAEQYHTFRGHLKQHFFRIDFYSIKRCGKAHKMIAPHSRVGGQTELEAVSLCTWFHLPIPLPWVCAQHRSQISPKHCDSKSNTSAGGACRSSLPVMPHSWVSRVLKSRGMHFFSKERK